MSRLWRRRVPLDLFIIAWLILIAGVIQGVVGVVFLVMAAR